ncbi:MAG: hypothetical protein HY926_13735 [Elusimicrobia bacterium]|nr:hypothetical protein [Elusimicrobiota bacterium]
MFVEAVKTGKLKHFFLVGGCDGAKPGRNYYTELAEAIPQDCAILALACGKYRFSKLESGDIGGIPSWYEQKAVCILLTLLHLGPSLPAFVGPRVLKVLVDNFGLKPIGKARDDLKDMLGATVAAPGL